jgi:hypothetical protein
MTMFNKLHALAFAAAMGTGVLACPPSGAGAASLPAPGLGDNAAAQIADQSYQEAATKSERRRQWYYDRRYHGYRYRYPYLGYRYYYGGYWYDQPYWNLTIPFYFVPPPRYVYRPAYRLSARHIDWCYARYRSYNVRTNTWVSYSGQVRQCISPWGP